MSEYAGISLLISVLTKLSAHPETVLVRITISLYLKGLYPPSAFLSYTMYTLPFLRLIRFSIISATAPASVSWLPESISSSDSKAYISVLSSMPKFIVLYFFALIITSDGHSGYTSPVLSLTSSLYAMPQYDSFISL